MNSRLFTSMLGKRSPLYRHNQPRILGLVCGRIHMSTIHSTNSVQYLSDHQQPASLLASAAIVAELRKANVECTSLGTQALAAIYGNMSAKVAFEKNSYNLSYPLSNFTSNLVDIAEEPEGIWEWNLNNLGVRQWRNYIQYKVCIDANVFKLWEALYVHSNAFKELIDEEEKENLSDWRSHTYPPYDCFLWEWMFQMIEGGFVERSDIDKLPEPLRLQDAVPGSRAST